MSRRSRARRCVVGVVVSTFGLIAAVTGGVPTGTTYEPARGVAIVLSTVDCEDIVCGNHNQVLL
jgi:hypothetical protein